MSLADAVARADGLVAAAEEQRDGQLVVEAAQGIMAAAEGAGPDELDTGIRGLRHLIDQPHPQVAGLFAIVAGGLVESGATRGSSVTWSSRGSTGCWSTPLDSSS